jgi:hypothetical protein
MAHRAMEMVAIMPVRINKPKEGLGELGRTGECQKRRVRTCPPPKTVKKTRKRFKTVP